MKNMIVLIAILIMAMNSFAQQFKEKFRVALPDTLTQPKLDWIDVDSDSLLDLMVSGSGPSGKQSFLFYQNTKTKSLQWKSSLATNIKLSSYQLYDIDLDNRIDIVISGEENGQLLTTAFVNNGDFSFSELATPIINLSGDFKLVDLDQDATKELIIYGVAAGERFTKVLKEKESTWSIFKDSLTMARTWFDAAHLEQKDTVKINIETLEVFDFDGDIDNDLFITGYYKSDSVFNGVLYNQGNYNFLSTSSKTFLTNAIIAKGDINLDGLFDIILSGNDQNGNPAAFKLINEKVDFQSETFLYPVKDGNILVADLNSDGRPEISFAGINSASDTINLVMSMEGKYDTLNFHNLLTQKFGDRDRDGDLDLVQLCSKEDSLNLVLYLNAAVQENAPPAIPSGSFAVSIFNRVLMYWNPSSDDHTPSSVITYDLSLFSSQTDLIHGDFDDILKSRLLVSHGNQGTNTFNLFQHLPGQSFQYLIQSVDNSFYASKKCKGGGASQCNASPRVIHVPVCKKEVIKYPSSTERVWFSFSKGFLGVHSQFENEVLTTDTLISFPKYFATCDSVKVYILDAKENYAKVTTEIKYVCEQSSVAFSAETSWPKVEWSSTVKNFISNAYKINYPITISDDTVTVKITTETTCTIQRNTILKVSKPVIDAISPYQILKGESVQLSATGAISYQWTPAASLDNPEVSAPKATPLITTEYTVEAFDSVGCSATANVLVVVEATAFIPTLFTPNGDTKNDVILIYGLGSVKAFSFSIRNREGNLMYETKDPNDATSNGWDGSVNGAPQPAGVYYWKIKGEADNGKHLLLNGKNSGSIVLIR